jgi:bacterial/archaeal transporter family protein
MWLIYAFLSSITAALVAILAKIGLKNIDSTLATAVRSIIMAVFLVLTAFFLKKFQGFSLSSFTQKDWLLIILAGICGALSWLFYFYALKAGLASKVAVVDRLSLVFIIALAAIFLGEKLNWTIVVGVVLMVFGAIMVTLK